MHRRSKKGLTLCREDGKEGGSGVGLGLYLTADLVFLGVHHPEDQRDKDLLAYAVSRSSFSQPQRAFFS